MGSRFRAVRATIAAAAAATVALGVTSVPVEAVVERSDLPTTTQVADIYPVFRDGAREVFRGNQIAGITDDCLSFEGGPVARSGKWATYVDAAGQSPYVDGGTHVVAFVYEFRGPRRAHGALRFVRRDVASCIGTHRGDGFRRTRDWVRVPRIGAERPVAWRELTTSRGAGDELFEDRLLDVWTRKGRYVVNVRAQKELSRPSVDKLVRLARLATRTVD